MRIDQQPGLYLHVPFCLSKCPYCGFASTVAPESVPSWLSAVEREVARAPTGFQGFDTLYLGGGTPSTLDDQTLVSLLSLLRGAFSFAPGAELTLEGNPADLTPEKLSLLRDLGIQRLSIGVQSFHDEELRFLQRRHTSREAHAALERARFFGFPSIGVDLIAGLAGQTIQGFQENLDQALEYDPEHISCYQLTIEKSTPFGERQDSGERLVSSEDKQVAQYLATSEYLEARGYLHYEVSNFARGQAHRSRHNQKYWSHVPYLGLGPAAHSFDGKRRWWNHRSLKAYLQALDAGETPVEGSEELSPEQLRTEEILLGLRTREGVSLHTLGESPALAPVLESLQQEGLVTVEGDRLVPTPQGFLVADRLPLVFP